MAVSLASFISLREGSGVIMRKYLTSQLHLHLNLMLYHNSRDWTTWLAHGKTCTCAELNLFWQNTFFIAERDFRTVIRLILKCCKRKLWLKTYQSGTYKCQIHCWVPTSAGKKVLTFNFYLTFNKRIKRQFPIKCSYSHMHAMTSHKGVKVQIHS